MAETAPIADVAVVVADSLFAEFLWKASPFRDQNWPCEDSKGHSDRKTHPSDVVFNYDEPYRPVRTYVNTDLKSYGAGSITPLQVKKAIFNLAQSLQCAELSSKWHDLYVEPETAHSLIGMLFIYNHDNAYDKNFDSLLASLDLSDVAVPRGSRLFILGPSEIHWLNNVAYEIRQMRGVAVGAIPARDACYFYHPHLARRKNVQVKEAKAATLEMLMGPWITMRYRKATGKDSVVLFYRGKGSKPDEFLQVIDYLMNYQMIEEGIDVQVRTLSADELAAAHFKQAVEKYIRDCEAKPDTAELLRAVLYLPINDIHSHFSLLVAGMRDA
jgi:hypothetical protein